MESRTRDVLTCIVDADLFLQALGEIGAGRIGRERGVGDVFVTEKLRHRIHQQVACLGPGHVVVAMTIVKVHDAIPFEAAKTEKRQCIIGVSFTI